MQANRLDGSPRLLLSCMLEAPLELRGPDGPVLRAIKAVARSWFTYSVARRRRTQVGKWVMAGECNGCGVCCERPSIQVDRLTWSFQPIRNAFLWWQRVVNGFHLIEAEPRRVFAFKCAYYDAQTKKCQSYDSRPGLCRDYPHLLLEQSQPEFYKECGYRAVAANSKSLLRILERSPMSEKERAELKRKLRVE